MKTVEEIRAENLQLLLERRYGGRQVRLARAAKVAPSQISRILSESKSTHKNLGPVLARRIEEVSDLPSGWMDQDHGAKENPFSLDSAQKKEPQRDPESLDLAQMLSLIQDLDDTQLAALKNLIDLVGSSRRPLQ